VREHDEQLLSSDAVRTHDRSVQQTSLTSTIAAIRESVGTAPYCRLGADGAGWPGMLLSQPSQLPNGPLTSDPLAPYDLSHLCDGRRTDFPLGMLVESVKVMLNGAYLQEGTRRATSCASAAGARLSSTLDWPCLWASGKSRRGKDDTLFHTAPQGAHRHV
jgi:hypothetical protein